jgi:superfamily I DNA/RNA helicase
LNNLGPGNYLVLSFIRKLVDDLSLELGDVAEVKTFHAFCKRILHETQGKVDIYPKLPAIIQKDAELLDHEYFDFEIKFRNLDETAPEISFFLTRGDYYKYLSFDDSVYRLYQLLKEDNSILDNYDQIIFDECLKKFTIKLYRMVRILHFHIQPISNDKTDKFFQVNSNNFYFFL